MNTKNLFIIIIIPIAFIILFISSNPLQVGIAKKSNIKEIYFVDNISDAHQEIINLFNRKNEGRIKIIPIDIPFYKFSTNERKELLMRALRLNSERIDIFAADIIWISRFAKWAEPLQNYFTSREIARYCPISKKIGYLGKNLIASPIYLDVSLLFYREDLLKNLPNSEAFIKKLNSNLTWEEFVQFGQKSNKINNFYYFPADEYEGLICSLSELILQQDSAFFYNGNFNLNDNESRKSFQFLVDLVNKYKLSPTESINFRENTAYSNFLQNDGIFLRGWQSFALDNKNLDKSTRKEKFLKTAEMPFFDGFKKGATIGGWNLMLSKNSKYKKEAVEFIKFTLSEEAQKILYEKGSYLPVIKSVYQDSAFVKKHPSLKIAKKILSNGILRPQMEDYTIVSDIIAHHLRLAISNKISVETALLQAQQTINQVRRKR